MKSFRKTILAAAVGTALTTGTLMPTLTRAQSSDATLRGRAPPGVDVTAKNIATGSTRRTRSSAEGAYTIPGLQPGTYNLDAGPGTEKTVTVTVASVATVDLVTAEAVETAGTELGEITVKSHRIFETVTPEVGNTVSLQQIQTVPQLTRNFLEFADTVPGMVFTVDSAGHTNLRSGGQNSSATNVYIDGVGQKNYVQEGGVSGQFQTRGNPFPQLAIGEYKVITSNYKAEYDQVSSAAIVAETKYGTNEFHGEAYGQYSNQNLRAETPSERAAGRKTPSNVKEYGASIGGPIIKDMLHFFFTYEGKRYTTPIAVIPGAALVDGVPAESVLPPEALAQLGPAAQPFTEDQYFGKLDFEPTDHDRLEATIKVRNENQVENIGTGEAESSGIDTQNNEVRYSLRWQHSGDHWSNEVLAQHENSHNAPLPINYGNGINYAEAGNNNTNILTTNAQPGTGAQNKGQSGPAIQDDLTLSDLHFLGNHTLKMGAKYKRVDLHAADALDINPQFFYNVTGAGTDTVPYKSQFTNPVAGQDPTAHSRDHQFGVYLQDDWAQNEHLTWFLGMRWDYERNTGYLKYVTPAPLVAALNSQDPAAPAGQTYAQTLSNGGVNINDFISNGHNRKADLGEIQPRLGFAVDVNADQRHVVFGGIAAPTIATCTITCRWSRPRRRCRTSRCTGLTRVSRAPRRALVTARRAFPGIQIT